MRIVDLLKKDAIILNADASNKEQMLDTLIGLHAKVGNINDEAAFKEGILKRESEGPTAIGDGICIPHSKNSAVVQPGIASVTIPDGIDCQALDGGLSNLFFMIAAPATGSDVHLEALARLSTILMDDDFRQKLLSAQSPDQYLKIIDEKETEKYGAEEKKEEAAPVQEAASTGYRILAVTACPTGIAHTYMAAESLEEKGKEMGIPLKAETNGSGGAKNILTKEEIAACDGIIIAADKNVEMARFDGKPVIKTKVQDGIHKPQELIEKVINGEAPIYHHTGGASVDDEGGNEGLGRAFYKHLMNGVSHMLPFVVGGGILIALAFLVDGKLPAGNFGMNTFLAGVLKTAGGYAFDFMLPVLAGYVAMSIADRPGLMPGFVGGFIAKQGISFGTISAAYAQFTPERLKYLKLLEAGKNPDPPTLPDLAGGAISGGFIGALFAGFAAGIIVLMLKKATEKMPSALDGLRPMLIYPVIGLAIVMVVMFAVNPFFGWLNGLLSNGLESLNKGGNIVLLGAILGGMMSVDMGGPFNKAAYVFATGALAWGTNAGYMVMASVMLGGMVPPLAIAISSWMFRNKFTDNDRANSPVNAIMGLCFISEAAIPYAAGDPVHVIPSCVVGSAVAGLLSMVFKCTLMAPHGGVFVFAVVGNAFMYIVSLLAGSLVGALLLGVLRKPVAKQ